MTGHRTDVEDLLRTLAPQVLGAVVRRYGNFDIAEDATQEALIAAATQWPRDGLPDNPRSWLITVAARRLTDLLRSEQTRRRRQQKVAERDLRVTSHAGDPGAPVDADDTLVLLCMCCHPALSPASQIALTLRAVAGLTTAEIARAFLVSEATMTRRITRAKQTIATSGVPFALPAASDLAERVAMVCHVLYVVFTEGYAATTGAEPHRPDLAAEAIRVTRLARRLLPGDAEVAGLLALMLLSHARAPARTGAAGELIPIAEQDRARWDDALITEGVELISTTLPRGPVGPYQLQAAIAALHDEAPSADDTDWPQILALYDLLTQVTATPVVALNRAVAVAMVHGPTAGLAALDRVADDPRLRDDHRLHAARAHLLEELGDSTAAHRAYLHAARLGRNLAQRRYLNARAARLATPATTDS